MHLIDLLVKTTNNRGRNKVSHVLHSSANEVIERNGILKVVFALCFESLNDKGWTKPIYTKFFCAASPLRCSHHSCLSA